ncbi:hypothetical protein PO124_16520 [Bacillus licheniformis]|nr:hypothetical protein [Bacillus licheniformis]
MYVMDYIVKEFDESVYFLISNGRSLRKSKTVLEIFQHRETFGEWPGDTHKRIYPASRP